MGNIYQRGKVYWIKYYRHGRAYRESSRSEIKKDATNLLKLREGEIASGNFKGLQVEKTTFDDLADDLITDYKINGKKSADRLGFSLSHLKKYFSGAKAVNISSDIVKKYVHKRLDQGAKNATVNRELSGLKRMLTLGMQQGKIARMPYISKLEENNVRTGFYEVDEFLALRAALPDYLKPVVTIAFYYGLRRGEILNLTWDRVSLRDGYIRLEAQDTKNKESRLIILNDEVISILTEVKRRRDQSYPTCSHVITKNGKRIQDFRGAWVKACKEIGLEGRLFHDFRRTAVRNMVRSGVPERVAMAISGHKTRSVFERYNIVSETDLRIATQKITIYAQVQKELVLSRQSVDGHNLGTVDTFDERVADLGDAQRLEL